MFTSCLRLVYLTLPLGGKRAPIWGKRSPWPRMGSRDKDAGDGRCMDLGMGKVVVDARLAWLPAVVYRRGLGMDMRAFGEVSGPSLTLRMALLLTFLAC